MATNLINENGAIPNGTPSKPFRESIENVNKLTKQGSLYVGTGTPHDVVAGVATEEESTTTYSISTTVEFEPPTSAGSGLGTNVLTYTGQGTTGLQWQPLSNFGLQTAICRVVDNPTETNPADGTWSGTVAPYTFTITQNEHHINANGNIFVQLMMSANPLASGGANNYEIVGATVTVDANNTVVITSNIKWNGKVLLMGTPVAAGN